MTESRPGLRGQRVTRWAKPSFVFLSGGAIVNIAVAWACGIWSDPLYTESRVVAAAEWPQRLVPEGLDQDCLYGSRWRGFGVDETDVHFIRPWFVGHPQGSILSAYPGREPTTEEWCEFMAEALHEMYSKHPIATRLEVCRFLRADLSQFNVRVSTGLPFRSLRGWIPPARTASVPPQSRVMHFPEGRSFAFARTIGTSEVLSALPYHPIWPGFAINTIFYALILWLLLFAPFALRRHLRLRRNLCPACAYPIGVSAICTECGGELPKCLDVKS